MSSINRDSAAANQKNEVYSLAVLSSDTESASIPEEHTPQDALTYLSGWRLHVATLALCLSIWLANFEIAIVSTSLVAITNDLGGFSKTSWIVTAYLLTFSGFLIIWAKLGEIFGRKTCIITSVFLFTVFSGGCGASQTVNQLIICRAFQGIGGSGAYALTLIMIFDLVPEVKYTAYTSLVTMMMAFSLLIGPLVGGAINSRTTWRWIFLLNVPAGAITILLLLFFVPNYFPHHGQPSYQPTPFSRLLSKDTFQRLDLIGAGALISSILFILVGLQLGGIQYNWSSGLIIALLVLSGLSFIIFLYWEWSLRRPGTKQEPVFPPQFFQNRVWLALLLNTFLVGLPFTVAVITIPLRIQVVYGISPLGAGLRLIPFVFTSPFAATLVSMAVSKLHIPPIFLLVLGTSFQVTGFALLSTLPTSGKFWSGQYGYQVIAAMGTGTNITATILMVPYLMDKKHRSIAMGAATQFRFLGGSLGLALVNSIGNTWVKRQLSHLLTPPQLTALLESTSILGTFPPEIQKVAQVILARGYNLEMRIVIGFCAAQFLATLLMWQKKPIRVI